MTYGLAKEGANGNGAHRWPSPPAPDRGCPGGGPGQHPARRPLRETVEMRYADGRLTYGPTALLMAWYPSAARDVRFSITIRQHKSLESLRGAKMPGRIPYWMDGRCGRDHLTPGRGGRGTRRYGSSSGGRPPVRRGVAFPSQMGEPSPLGPRPLGIPTWTEPRCLQEHLIADDSGSHFFWLPSGPAILETTWSLNRGPCAWYQRYL